MEDRDQFAAAALTGLLCMIPRYQLGPLTKQAWEIADAMMRERGTEVRDNCLSGNNPEIACPVTEPMPKEKRAEVSDGLQQHIRPLDAADREALRRCDEAWGVDKPVAWRDRKSVV